MGVALLRDAAKDRSSRELIDSIERSASRGADLVKQVLSFARGVEGARVPVQIARALRELESIVENTFPKNLRMQIEAAGDLRPVLGDPTQIHQVLLNLCVNARDAMPAGGELTLRAANVEIDLQYATLNRNVDPGRYVRIDVVDTGSGMPPEVVERIFEPFFTTKEVGSGTGLGLSTVIGIVRSHGGFINVYSEVGQGSTFRVHLPAHEADGAPADEPPPAERIERGRGELVLVVDDEATIRSVTKQTLEAFGYRVLTADDGAQAVALYAQHRQDIALVLTDMMMPVMDGPAMIAALRRIAPRLPIVAASGLNANGHVARAAGAGVRHFLAKPYSAESLVRTIRKVLDEAAERPAGSHPPVVP
jgi:CheY-like chemotaxis protein